MTFPPLLSPRNRTIRRALRPTGSVSADITVRPIGSDIAEDRSGRIRDDVGWGVRVDNRSRHRRPGPGA